MVFVSELDHLTPRRGLCLGYGKVERGKLGRDKPVKILESLYGIPEICGQEGLQKKN